MYTSRVKMTHISDESWPLAWHKKQFTIHDL